jgi:hypothetical protein
VVQVLTNAAQRVAHEAQNQASSIMLPTGPAQALAQASLAKQQQVLTATAQAINSGAGLNNHGVPLNDPVASASSMLVATAQQVVHQAARQVQADRNALAALQHMSSAPVPPPPPPPVSINDVTVVTQSAVAHAVAITGNLSSDVEVMMTANALIQQRSRAPSLPMNPPPILPSEPVRPPAVSLATHPALPTTASLNNHGFHSTNASTYHRWIFSWISSFMFYHHAVK